MSWNRQSAQTTKHDHEPNYGRKVAGCPRCDELLAGAAPIAQPWRSRTTRAQQDAERAADITAHFASAKHRNECGPQGSWCTYGQW